jgi:hypothetical protein
MEGPKDEYGYPISKWKFPTDKDIFDKEKKKSVSKFKKDEAPAERKMKRKTEHVEIEKDSEIKPVEEVKEIPMEDNKESKKTNEIKVEEIPEAENKEAKKTEEKINE